MVHAQLITPFVGRAKELEVMTDGLEEARSGHGRLFLVAGEPGIGKSRLADELAMRARASGFAVLWGRAWEDAGAPPYWPWVQILRSHLRATPENVLRSEVKHAASDLAQILPELHDLFPGLESRPESESDTARFQLFVAVADTLRAAAGDRPILAVVDDLQAADTPSILLLRFLATQLGDMRIVVVGTYRDVALGLDHPLAIAVAEMSREPIARQITLRGLETVALGEYIGATTGLEPTARALGAIWRGTKGNPLFVSEAVRLLSSEGRIDEVAELPSLRIAIPAGIHDVIARRIAHLEDETKRTLAFGAVLGPEFATDALRSMSGIDSARLLDLLEAAVDAGLLLRVTAVAGRYRFSHDLVREVLYQDIPPSERSSLHARTAEVLEQLHAADIEPHLAQVAFHYVEAASGEPAVAPKAVAYAMRAASRSSRALAYEEAARQFRMALVALDIADAGDDETRSEILLGIGDAESRAGRVPQARETYEVAVALARQTGNTRHLARAALGVGGRYPWLRAGSNTDLIPLLTDALDRLGDDDDQLRVRLLTRLACAARSMPERRALSDQLSAEAVTIARQLGDRSTLSYALSGRFWATWWPENPEVRLPLSEEMRQLAENRDDPERLIDSNLMLHFTYLELGRMPEANSALERVQQMVNELHQPAQLWLGVAPVAELALFHGDFASAADLIKREFRPENRWTPSGDEISAATMHLVLLCREQARPEDAESAVRAAARDFPWYPLHRAAHALVLLDLGRDDEARTVFTGLAGHEFAALYPDNEWLLGMCLASEVGWRLEDADNAEILYGKLEPYAGRHAIGHTEGSVGAVDRYLGLLAVTIGRLDAAEGHLQDAVRVNDQLTAWPWAAHSRHDLAALLRLRDGPGDGDRARAIDGEALEAATRMGMIALQQSIRDEGGITASPPLIGQVDRTGEFRREGEYWTIRFGADPFRLRHVKGLGYLARLLADPGREFHALDLAGDAQAQAPRDPSPDDAITNGFGDAGTVLDSAAKEAYRRRLEDLREAVAEAEAQNDAERATRARDEIEFLADELAAGVGLGGRDRRAASASERARLSVTRAIRAAMTRIAAQDPQLGRHLDATVRTGTYCSYRPDPQAAIRWVL